MLPTIGPLPQGPGWAFEFAWDGERTLAEVSPGRVRLFGSERGLTPGYPELDVLAEIAGRRRIVLDGTVVALDARGRPSQSRLRRRRSTQQPSEAVRRRVPIAYYVFDLLRLDNRPTYELPYVRRRELLEDLDLGGGVVAVAPSFADTDGRTVLDTAVQYGLPGVIAKRARSRYQPGRRSRSWVQTSQRPTQDVTIGGWLPGTRGVGSLLIGLPTERGLHFVGQVGTGLTDAERRELAGRLSAIERPTSPFTGPAPAPACIRWVAPDLLGEVAYRDWTPDGRLAQPTWRGLRPGKHPAAVRLPVLIGAQPSGADDDERAELDEAVRQARAEVDALRAQISPHFHYNVLNTITSFVRFDPAHARELLVELADFSRYSFREDAPASTLGAELDNVRRYLRLEQARFGERLRFDIQVPPGALDVTVPHLSLQLAVEHAVQHGIETKPGGGTVTITAAPEGRDIVLAVSEDCTSGPSGQAGAGGTGGPAPWLLLRTLDERLRAANGDRGALRVDAGSEGTSLTFRVPCPR